jgi:hypothetical protein
VLATAERKTLADAGALYIDHLEHVMDRKRSTIQDYRGYLRGHLEGFFGDTPIDRIDPAGTQMAAAGAPLRAIQEWMGDADAKTTEIYRHYAPDPTNGAQLVERAFSTTRPSAPDESPTREQA